MFICLEQNLMLSKLVLGLLCTLQLLILLPLPPKCGLQVCTIMPDWKG